MWANQRAGGSLVADSISGSRLMRSGKRSALGVALNPGGSHVALHTPEAVPEIARRSKAGHTYDLRVVTASPIVDDSAEYRSGCETRETTEAQDGKRRGRE